MNVSQASVKWKNDISNFREFLQKIMDDPLLPKLYEPIRQPTLLLKVR